MRVHVNSIEATVNIILREWRDLWPGGSHTEGYPTVGTMVSSGNGAPRGIDTVPARLEAKSASKNLSEHWISRVYRFSLLPAEPG